nr:retrovirus-related Pol polyprotein from transposon TNT 1-94 [Tanacetum cinerariifolium]
MGTISNEKDYEKSKWLEIEERMGVMCRSRFRGKDNDEETRRDADVKKCEVHVTRGYHPVRMKALLEQQGLAAALKELPATIIAAYGHAIQKKAYNTLILCLGDRVLREITKKTTATGIWKKLDFIHDKFHKLVGDLAALNTGISDEDQALLLLASLPSAYDNFVETLLYGRDILKLEEVLATLDSRELQKMTEAKGDGGEGLYMRGRSRSERYAARNAEYGGQVRFKFKFHVGQRHVCYGIKAKLNSDGYSRKREFYRKDAVGQDKGYKGFTDGTIRNKRANCVYTMDGHAVTMKTLKGRKQFGEYQTE